VLRHLRRLIDRVIAPSVFTLRRAGIAADADIGVHVGIGVDTVLDSACSVGAYSYVGMRCNVTATSIGRYCSIANGVQIGQGEHPTDRVSTSSQFMDSSYAAMTSARCEIGDDVWIGAEVVVLRGVTIGTGSIVAANSVVTRSCEPYSIIGGVPARLIRPRFTPEQVELLLASLWWTHDLPEAKRLVEALQTQLDALAPPPEPGP
jgi:Acetyltransferase (isoleucine patch superfamily)